MAAAKDMHASPHWKSEDVRAGKMLYVELRTPDGAAYVGNASSVLVPGRKGPFGVLPRHAPILSSLEVGFTRIRDPLGKEWRFVTGLGFVEVNRNEVLVMVDFADDVNDIDVDRARAALDRARARLRSPGEEVDEARAQAALERASMRLRYAGGR